MFQKIFSIFILFLFSYFSFLPLSHSCTDFFLSNGNMRVNGRSMEFAEDLRSQMVVHPRGEKRSSVAPQNKQGLAWTSQYGFVGLNSWGMDSINDGMNEAGLSLGALWLPGSQYQEVDPGEEAQAIALQDISLWILGNFKTVDEVKAGLPKVKVWGMFVPAIKMVPPLHFALHDVNGKSLVIEFIKGQVQIYDNPLGVLTNAPTFDWHKTNLTNYVNLTNLNAPFIYKGQTINGSGLRGLPGDWTPVSRFVRAVAMVMFANPTKTNDETTNLAFHILNVVDIPKGIMKNSSIPPVEDYTQWAVVKDLANKVFYFRTYENMNIRSLDLKKIDWNQLSEVLSFPIQGGEFATGVNERLSKAAK